VYPSAPPALYGAAIPAGAETARPPEAGGLPASPVPIGPEPLSYRLIGEAMAGYLLVETPDALWIIDKHAAHERLLFNRIQAGERPFLSQRLLVPRTVVLTARELDVLLEGRGFLEENGFEFDQSGPNTLAVRAAPGDIDESDIPALLSEISSLLNSGKHPDLRGGALEMIACKAAVKLGRSSRREDMEHLAGLVMETPGLRHCPHGRPVAVRLTRSDLGRQFGR
jgi:DNA mismatch repair protein MutL